MTLAIEMPRARYLAALVLALALAFAAVVVRANRGGDETSSAAVLPGACDNLVLAAQAKPGDAPSRGDYVTGAEAFVSNPSADRRETLQALADGCTAEAADEP